MSDNKSKKQNTEEINDIITENKENVNDNVSAASVNIAHAKSFSAKMLKKYKFGPFCIDGVDISVIGTVLLMLLLYSFIQKYAAIIIVYGESMFPTYENGDVCTCNPRFKEEDLQKDTVIVFKSDKTNKKEFIKRIVAVPGEKICIRDRYLYVNDVKQETLRPSMDDPGILSSPLVLGKDEYFVLGDNRNHSYDSRFIGPVHIKDIKGVVGKKLLKLPI